MPTLMVSISGIRGIVGDGLDPEVINKYAGAYADFIGEGTIVIGRDSRISGEMVKSSLTGVLLAKGLNVIDIGVCPTPTVQYTVKTLKASGGIAISASHNPNEWNALKLLNSTGQFMSPEEHEILKQKLNNQSSYKAWDKLGTYTFDSNAVKAHKEAVLNMPLIEKSAISARKFRVLVDCVNGAGYVVIPQLLRDFGCEVIETNCSTSGIFPRLPEPVPENLVETMNLVKKEKVDLCVVVDPDVDRLVLITDKGEPISEENTITQAIKFVTSKVQGPAVVNLSTTRACEDVAKKNGCQTFRSPVGEANVVKKMKEVNAVIGGEGSGGVIYPALHYGRDALAGIALTLQHLLEFGGTISELKASLPQYFMVKKKIDTGSKNPDDIVNAFMPTLKNAFVNTDDGLRADFDDHWIHLRKSNTEPIIRLICEAETGAKAQKYSEEYFAVLTSLAKG